MVIVQQHSFFTNATATGVSDDLINVNGEQLALQVSGEATGLSIKVYGAVDKNSSEYTELTAITPAFNLVTPVTTNGVYYYGVDGLYKVKVQIVAITGGSVTVVGALTRGGE